MRRITAPAERSANAEGWNPLGAGYGPDADVAVYYQGAKSWIVGGAGHQLIASLDYSEKFGRWTFHRFFIRYASLPPSQSSVPFGINTSLYTQAHLSSNPLTVMPDGRFAVDSVDYGLGVMYSLPIQAGEWHKFEIAAYTSAAGVAEEVFRLDGVQFAASARRTGNGPARLTFSDNSALRLNADDIQINDDTGAQDFYWPDEVQPASTGLAAPTLRNKTQRVNAASANHQVDVPAGVASGDLLVAYVHLPSAGENVGTPASWTRLVNASGLGRGTLAVFWKLASGAEPASYTFPSANLTSATMMYAIQGAHPTNPIANSQTFGISQSTSASSPAVDTRATDTLTLHCVAGKSNANFAFTSQPAFDGLQAAYDNTGHAVLGVAASQSRKGGMVGGASWGSNANNVFTWWGAATLIVRPDPNNPVGAFVREGKGKAGDSGIADTVIDCPAYRIGDLLTLVLAYPDPAANPVTVPTGFTLAGSQDGAAGEPSFRVYTKIAQPDEPLTYTIHWGGSMPPRAVVLAAVGGVDKGNPINAFAGASAPNATQLSAPAVNTTVDGCLLLRGWAQRAGFGNIVDSMVWDLDSGGTDTKTRGTKKKGGSAGNQTPDITSWVSAASAVAFTVAFTPDVVFALPYKAIGVT